jgi:hypothetical protein
MIPLVAPMKPRLGRKSYDIETVGEITSSWSGVSHGARAQVVSPVPAIRRSWLGGSVSPRPMAQRGWVWPSRSRPPAGSNRWGSQGRVTGGSGPGGRAGEPAGATAQRPGPELQTMTFGGVLHGPRLAGSCGAGCRSGSSGIAPGSGHADSGGAHHPTPLPQCRVPSGQLVLTIAAGRRSGKRAVA